MVIDTKWNLRHDYFNLAVLPVVCAASIYYLVVDRSAYALQYYVFLWYMVVDTLWLVILPNSVASPATIIAHHVVCLIGWNIPMMCENRYAEVLSLGPLVEINTWLLIARRNYKDAHLLNTFFHITWVGFRLIMYPIILIMFVGQYVEESREFETWIHVGLAVLLLMLGINLLNAKWSIDLFAKKGESTQPASHRRGL